MKKQLLFSIAIFSYATSVYSQTDSLKTYLLHALDTIKAHSYHRNSLDWDSIYAKAIDSAKGAKDFQSLVPAIDYAVDQLQDYHSSFLAIDPEEEEGDIEYLYATNTYEQHGQPFPIIESRLIDNKYAYISLPGVVLENKRYANALLDSLKVLDKLNPGGWIVDLRMNDGGMFHPMYIGLIPFLDRDSTFSTIDADGVESFDFVQHERLYIDTSRFARLAEIDSMQSLELKNSDKPIVVLVGNKTASSGEFAAVTLLGQANVRLIGTKTAGLTSSNELFRLKDGSGIILTVGVLKDRKGKIYRIGEGITPDIQLAIESKDNGEALDELYMQQAKKTLGEMHVY